ncbi:MAG: glutamate racemase [Campylobacterota bacterium]|nr:glutamate racemase [Campylobacterota bacterium]
MKVGVFDSGLGGLTVVNAIIQTFNNAEIFYIADTQVAPYGIKSKEEILQHSFEVTKYLIAKHEIDVLIVACNTATSAAIKDLRTNFPNIIIIGTEPGIRPALNTTKTGSVGVLATRATLKGDKYQLLVNELSSSNSVKLYEQACPGLVEQIELGKIQTDDTFDMLENWLKPMCENGVDTIVLGCTHYPLVSSNIKKIMGENIKLIETGNAIANRLKDLTKEKNYATFENIKVFIYFTGELNTGMVNHILKDWLLGGKIIIRETKV